MEVRHINLLCTKITLFGDGPYYMMLNGVYLNKEFNCTVEEAVICAMQVTMTIYMNVTKEIGNESDKYLKSADTLPVQSGERFLDETDFGDGQLRVLYPQADGTVSISKCGAGSEESRGDDEAPQ